MTRKRLPPATPDRIGAIADAADQLEIIAGLSRAVGVSGLALPREADWLAQMALANIDTIRDALQ